MTRLSCTPLAVFLSAWALAAGAPPRQTQPKPTPPPARDDKPHRVRVKLEGFDLAPGPQAGAGTQIGAGSRVIGEPVVAYAPNKAYVYTLHPAFEWGGAGARFEFQLSERDGATILFGTRVIGKRLVYPADGPALSPGRTYEWIVAAIGLAGRTRPIELIVIGGAQREAVAVALGAQRGYSLAAQTARAEVFVARRLWYDAVDAYTQLIARFPDTAQLYERRGVLYDQIPAAQPKADADFQAAGARRAARR